MQAALLASAWPLLFSVMIPVGQEESEDSSSSDGMLVELHDDSVEVNAHIEIPGWSRIGTNLREDGSAESQPRSIAEDAGTDEASSSEPRPGPEPGADAGGDVDDSGSSWLYCMTVEGRLDPNCQEQLGSFGAYLGCETGAGLAIAWEASDPDDIGCLDETPEPEPPEDEDVVEAVEDDAGSDWDEIVEQIPGQVQQQFASLPIDGGQVAFEEELLGFGLIDRHTNIFAEVETQTFSEELLGIEVEIRVIPVEYHFDYGDGTTRTSATPGAAAQLGPEAELIDAQTATSHVYESTGTYPVAVTSTFIGEYRIAGQSWTPIAASTQVQATGGEADIWRMDTRHVSGACEDPSQWGCDGPFILEEGDQPPEAFRN